MEKIVIPVKKLQYPFTIPVYGFGTWQMGGGYTRNPGNDDRADITAIKIAIQFGVTHIDTAELYAETYTEVLVGQAIKDFDRKTLFIVSKVSPEHFHYDSLIRSAKASLKRLQVVYLDLYLLHWYDPEIPLAETMRAMDTLVTEGLVKHIGVSNFTVNQLQKAQSLTKNKLVVNQVHYNLQQREIEANGVLAYCQKNDVVLVAWRPVAKGVLAHTHVSIMKEMMGKYKKTATQIALNWLITQKNVVTISKTRSIEHLEENLGAVGWEISDEDIERLRQEFPNQQR